MSHDAQDDTRGKFPSLGPCSTPGRGLAGDSLGDEVKVAVARGGVDGRRGDAQKNRRDVGDQKAWSVVQSYPPLLSMLTTWTQLVGRSLSSQMP